METNETNPEGQQDASSLEGEQTPVEPSEGDKTPTEEGPVPYSRFHEVIEKNNELKESVETLKEDMETLKQQQPEKEEDEPTTWKEMEERAVSKAVEKMKGDMTKTSKAEIAQEQAIEAGFKNLKALGNEITKEVEDQVLKQMIKTGKGNVIDNYLQIKDSVDKQIKSQEIKQAGFVPSSDKGADVERPAIKYESVQGKTPMDIVREAGETQK